MKNIITLIIIALSILSCKAQNPIVGLDARQHNTPNGAYYKDLNSELNKFEGTWKFTNNDVEFTIVLDKITQLQIDQDFRDYLIGEYSYSENNTELINTLPLNLNEENSIGGSYILMPNERPSCSTCTPNERRINMYFSDPERKYLQNTIVLRYIVNSSPPQMEAKIYQEHGGILPYNDAPTVPRVPYGEYLMVKQ